MNKTDQPAEVQPKPAKSKGKWKWFFLTVSLILLFLFLKFIGLGLFQAKQKIVISQQTTRITEPVDEEGYVDYLEYLNLQASEGVTPENNFEYEIRKILGTDDLPEDIREEYLQRIGLSQDDILPKEKQFQTFENFLEAKLTPDDKSYQAQQEYFQKQDEIITIISQPWSEQEAPLVAEWLTINNPHLDAVVEASKKAESYTPYLVDIQEIQSSLLAMDLYPVQQRRNLVRSLNIRSLKRINNGDSEGAAKDLFAIHRISKLTRDNSSTLIELLMGAGFNSIACHTDLVMLEKTGMTQEQILSYLSELNRVITDSNYLRIYDHEQRFTFLDVVINMKRTSGSGSNIGQDVSISFSPTNIDYNAVLRMTNREYDSVVKILEIEDPVEKFQKLDQHSLKIKKLFRSATDLGENVKQFFRAGSLNKYATQKIWTIYYALLSPAISTALEAEYGAIFKMDATRIAFALKAWQLDHGSYPDKLDLLVPDYLSEIPPDPFTGKQPVYKQTEDGFLIYSIGFNRKDENGLGPRGIINKTRDGDDVTVQFPYKSESDYLSE